jgi:hypothetical protein
MRLSRPMLFAGMKQCGPGLWIAVAVVAAPRGSAQVKGTVELSPSLAATSRRLIYLSRTSDAALTLGTTPARLFHYRLTPRAAPVPAAKSSRLLTEEGS